MIGPRLPFGFPVAPAASAAPSCDIGGSSHEVVADPTSAASRRRLGDGIGRFPWAAAVPHLDKRVQPVVVRSTRVMTPRSRRPRCGARTRSGRLCTPPAVCFAREMRTRHGVLGRPAIPRRLDPFAHSSRRSPATTPRGGVRMSDSGFAFSALRERPRNPPKKGKHRSVEQVQAATSCCVLCDNQGVGGGSNPDIAHTTSAP